MIKKKLFLVKISVQVLKLALSKSLRASDDGQGINKLWPIYDRYNLYTRDHWSNNNTF